MRQEDGRVSTELRARWEAALRVRSLRWRCASRSYLRALCPVDSPDIWDTERRNDRRAEAECQRGEAESRHGEAESRRCASPGRRYGLLPAHECLRGCLS